jgi:hypothetical protein
VSASRTLVEEPVSDPVHRALDAGPQLRATFGRVERRHA